MRSTIFELEQGSIRTVRSGHKPYPRGSFDFIAAYVAYEDAWYIIPAEQVQGMECVSLHTNIKRANYEKYREAWYLLQPDPEPGGDHIDRIQGCSEEFSSAAEAGMVGLFWVSRLARGEHAPS